MRRTHFLLLKFCAISHTGRIRRHEAHTMSLLVLLHLNKQFRENTLLDSIDLKNRRGDRGSQDTWCLGE